MRMPLIAILAGLVLTGAATADPVDTLHGLWEGDAMHLALDVERSQGRVDTEKPFQWERLIVKSVSGNEVVFTIGPRLYSAVVEPDSLTVEAPGYPGPQRLTRMAKQEEAPPPPAPAAMAPPPAAPTLMGPGGPPLSSELRPTQH